MATICVCTFYHFFDFVDCRQRCQSLLRSLQKHHVKGTLIIACEGINGSIAGLEKDIDKVIDDLCEQLAITLECRRSYCQQMPFLRTKVKVKQEIVTMGVPIAIENTGIYVEPQQWNELLRNPEVLVIDTRNQYEIEIGTFENAINPKTDCFRQFPHYAEQLRGQERKKIAMFCTGGIRCEKSTAYLKQQGFQQIYHLRGGILNYLQSVTEEDSLWRGECFVFDERVALNQHLQQDRYKQCFACRYPLTAEEMEHPHYRRGESCPRCYGQLSERQKQRFKERQKQIKLAEQQGRCHLG